MFCAVQSSTVVEGQYFQCYRIKRSLRCTHGQRILFGLLGTSLAVTQSYTMYLLPTASTYSVSHPLCPYPYILACTVSFIDITVVLFIIIFFFSMQWIMLCILSSVLTWLFIVYTSIVLWFYCALLPLCFASIVIWLWCSEFPTMYCVHPLCLSFSVYCAISPEWCGCYSHLNPIV